MPTKPKRPPFHCEITPLRRHEGARIAHWFAYVSGLRVKDLTNETHSRRGGGVVYCARYGAEGIPLEELAAEVERAEKRENSVIGRRGEFALPASLPDREAIDLVGEFGWFIFQLVGAPVMFGVHRPEGSENLHGHLIILPRVWDAVRQRFGAKTRSLDVPYLGGKIIAKIRWELARLINAKLPAAMAVQPAARPGEPRRRHLGPAMHRLESAGVKTAYGDYNRLVDEYESIDRELTLLKRRRMEMEQSEIVRPERAPGAPKLASKALLPNGPVNHPANVAEEAQATVPAVSDRADAKQAQSNEGRHRGGEKSKAAPPARQPAAAEPAVVEEARDGVASARRGVSKAVETDARPSPIRPPMPAIDAEEIEDLLSPIAPGHTGARRVPEIRSSGASEPPAV